MKRAPLPLIAAIGILAAPAWAVSLPAAGPAQPMPESFEAKQEPRFGMHRIERE